MRLIPFALTAAALAIAACAPAPGSASHPGAATPPAGQGHAGSAGGKVLHEGALAATGALRPGQSAMALLEHAAGRHDGPDSGPAGVDEVPLHVAEAGELAVSFDPGPDAHGAELRGPDGHVIARLTAASPAFHGHVPAGRLVLALLHDGKGDAARRRPVFVHYARPVPTAGRFGLLAVAPATEVHTTAAGCPGCDLSGLAMAQVVASGQNFDGADITAADLSGAVSIGGSFRGAKFGKANMAGAQLQGCDLQGATLLGATLVGASFKRSQARGAAFNGARVGETGFVGVDARGASFQDLTYSTSNATGPAMDFADADLADATFRGTAVSGSFVRATLTRASFVGTGVFGDLTDVSAAEADFTGAEVSATLTRGYFAGASFRRAFLRSDFSGTVLDRASFRFATNQRPDPAAPGKALDTSDDEYVVGFNGASAVGTDFGGARLPGAQFEGANLEGATFFRANIEGAAIAGRVQGNGSLAAPPSLPRVDP